MSVVKFEFDKEKDLKNIWNTANAKSSYGNNWKDRVTKNILEICENKKYEKCKKELSETMKYLHGNALLKLVVKSLNDSWGKIEKEYFRRLENLTGNKFPVKKVVAYLTTAGRCPYNPNPKSPSFFFNFFGGLPQQLQIAGHELMHIHLHNTSWWKEVEKELGNKKTHDLKEAMTKLLNSEFRDLWIINDDGYPNHIELRKYISSEWKKKKDFNLLTKNCIAWIKQNGVK